MDIPRKISEMPNEMPIQPILGILPLDLALGMANFSMTALSD